MGAIYGTAMHELRAQRRVRVKFPVESGYPLVSAWDLGINDATAIWAAQVVGYELRWRKFYQSSGKELAEYAEVIRAWERESLGTDAAKTLGEALFRGLVPLAKGLWNRESAWWRSGWRMMKGKVCGRDAEGWQGWIDMNVLEWMSDDVAVWYFEAWVLRRKALNPLLCRLRRWKR